MLSQSVRWSTKAAKMTSTNNNFGSRNMKEIPSIHDCINI